MATRPSAANGSFPAKHRGKTHSNIKISPRAFNSRELFSCHAHDIIRHEVSWKIMRNCVAPRPSAASDISPVKHRGKTHSPWETMSKENMTPGLQLVLPLRQQAASTDLVSAWAQKPSWAQKLYSSSAPLD